MVSSRLYRRFKINLALLFTLTCFLYPKNSLSELSTSSSINDYIVQVVKSYPTDGTHKYSWPKKDADGKDLYDGVTQDIYYDGIKYSPNAEYRIPNVRILRGDGNGSAYCCGLTLEVFLKAMDKYNSSYFQQLSIAGDAITKSGIRWGRSIQGGGWLYADENVCCIFSPIKGLDTTNFSNFKNLWFCPGDNAMGPGEALMTFGMGTMVTDWNQAQFGDFVQIWRWNGSGHSMVFVDWIKNSTGTITGLKYWSSQKKTNGIGYNTEYFAETKGIDRKRTFICRVTDPQTWK